MEDLLRVGVISSTHGIRGEVKVFPTTDDVNRFKKLKKVLLDTGKEKLALEVENVKFFKQFAILKFKGIDNINDIEKYKGKDLLVTRDQAVPLEKDEFFICDLIDCVGYTENGTEVGKLTEVMQTGANDVFVFKRANGKEVLVPYIDQCVTAVDIEKKKIELHLLDGMMTD
ncbi:MAG: ribosome maturation factor RimM [Clostridiales bacterium]|nr:ribosome maturation factor RimM [Clostridiales bacterium]